MPSNLLPTEPTYSSGTTDEGEYLSAGDRKAIFKKRRVSGADFKRGSSAGSSVGEARGEKLTAKDFGTKTGKLTKILRDTRIKVNLNEKKIAALEGADIKQLEPGQDQAQPTESLIGPLKTIDNSVNSIVNTLKASNKADLKAQNDARKAAEKDKRKKSESKLEAITGPIGKVVDKVLAPVKSIFGKILGFLTTILLGSAAVKIWEWFSDPANTEKISSIFKFLKDWWPVLLAGIMAFFGPILGPMGMIAGTIALLSWGIPKIIEAVNWVKGLFGVGIQKELDGIDKESKDVGAGLEKTVDEDLTKDTDKILSDEGAPDTENQPIPKEAQQVEVKGKEGQKKMEEVPALNMFAGGGRVPGSGSGDTVPAMLTPGEFVMSIGAVEQYGANTLAGMNAAAGGTNRPTVGRYQGGGSVKNVSNKNVTNNLVGGGDGPRIHYNGGGVVNMNTSLPRIPVQYFKGGGKVEGLPGLGGGGTGTNSLTEQAKVKTWRDAIGDFFSGDDGKSRWSHKNNGMSDNASKIVKSPPSRPITKIAYDQQISQQQRGATQSSASQELPQFSAGAMRSGSKIATMGITV